jgi:hypothetical protein
MKKKGYRVLYSLNNKKEALILKIRSGSLQLLIATWTHLLEEPDEMEHKEMELIQTPPWVKDKDEFEFQIMVLHKCTLLVSNMFNCYFG